MKKIYITLFLLIAIILCAVVCTWSSISYHSFSDCDENIGSGVLSVTEEYIVNFDDFDNFDSSAPDMRRYAENTPDGVKTAFFDPFFASGRLYITAKSARRVQNLDELDVPLDGFCRDARLYKDQNNQWQEGEMPRWIQEDGNFDEKFHLILVDISIENDGAMMVTGIPETEHLPDPYTFDVRAFFSLYDLNTPISRNRFVNVDYFSGLSDGPATEFLFHLEPGEKKDYVIGFVVEDEWLDEPSNLSQLHICNTQGVRDSVFIPLNLKVD